MPRTTNATAENLQECAGAQETSPLKPSHFPRIVALTALSGSTFLFLVGCVVGRWADPVPGMIAGVSALWWLAPALVVFASVPPLVICQRALSRERPGVDRAPAMAAASIGSTSSSEGSGSGLDLFPTEALTAGH